MKKMNLDDKKKRILKLVGIIVLVIAIISVAALNVLRRSATSQTGTGTALIAVTPTQDWMPAEGAEVNEDEIPPNTIVIKDFAYHPATLTVREGTEVRIINADAAEHSISSDTALFDTGVLLKNDQGKLTFATPGTYTYHCRKHSAMQGSIIVTP